MRKKPFLLNIWNYQNIHQNKTPYFLFIKAVQRQVNRLTCRHPIEFKTQPTWFLVKLPCRCLEIGQTSLIFLSSTSTWLQNNRLHPSNNWRDFFRRRNHVAIRHIRFEIFTLHRSVFQTEKHFPTNPVATNYLNKKSWSMKSPISQLIGQLIIKFDC